MSHDTSQRGEAVVARRTLILRIFVPFAFGYFLSYLFRVVNAVISGELTEDLGIDASVLGLLTSVYFLSFAAFQLPLGHLLDKVGPRRTEAVLLLFAAAGALVFANAQSVNGLIVGRLLIGFGVSACLMGAFKAYVEWFPGDRLPLVNGFQMAAGGLGALVATRPVEMMLTVMSWRGVFTLLAVCALLSAALVFFVVPEKSAPKNAAPSSEGGFQGFRVILTSFQFWSVAPLATLSQATILALQSLWVGTWLRDVAGLSRSDAADVLAFMTLAMIAGFVVLGAFADRLGRQGYSTTTIAVGGMTLAMFPQLAVVLGSAFVSSLIWVPIGFLGSTGIITYAALSQTFPKGLAGRVITALNLLVFVGAFVIQWGMGGIINRWQTEAGGYEETGYQVAFGLMLALQFLALVWYLTTKRFARGVR